MRVTLLQITSPTGVIDYKVEHEVAIQSVHLISQFDKLVNAGGFAVELNQGRVDQVQIQ